MKHLILKNKRVTLLIATGVMVLLGFLIVGFYWYQGMMYVKTDDARLASPVVTITPQLGGVLTNLPLDEGDEVQPGDIVAVLDTSQSNTSAVPSISGLLQVAPLAAHRTEITSPIEGKVLKINLVEGQNVMAGQSILVLAESRNMYVSANIEETKIANLKPGQRVDIKVDALGNKSYQGRIASIGEATVSTFAVISSQSSNGNFTKVTQVVPVKIQFPAAGELALKPGLSAVIRIHLH